MLFKYKVLPRIRSELHKFPSPLREKVAESRMRDQQRLEMILFLLSLALSLRVMECF